MAAEYKDSTSLTVKTENNINNFFYYGLLAYTVIFFSQIGGRIPILGAVRVELLSGSFLLFCIFYKIFNREFEVETNPVNKAAFFFLSACFITIPFAYYKSYSIEIFIRLLKFFAIYIMIVAGIQSEKQLKGFIWIYVLVVAYIFTDAFSYAIRGMHIRYNSGAMRLFGFGIFAHPNGLGGLIAGSLPFFYYLMKSQRAWLKKSFLVVLILIGLRTIMYTNSRTAFVGVVAFGLCLFLFSKKKLRMIAFIIISGILVWHFAPSETKERFLSLKEANRYVQGTDDGSDAMGNRIQLIKNSFKIFLRYPITGAGVGNFFTINGHENDMWLPAHNQYLQMLSETGIIGSFAFIFLIVAISRNLNESFRIIYEKKMEDSFLHYLTISVSVFLLLRLVIGLFGDELYDNCWWIAGGLSLVIVRILSNYDDRISDNSIVCDSKDKQPVAQINTVGNNNV